jgi:galactose mutarotase-like enzyme
MSEKNWILTDTEKGIWIDDFQVTNQDLDAAGDRNWRVTKKMLRGGLQDGVDIVEIDNGSFRFTILPTRGMGIWKGHYKGLSLGWNSPVKGPVHPKWVNPTDRNGLGWLQGFDEWIVRCGLHFMGPPGEDRWMDSQGQANSAPLTLHGRIANLPASYLAVSVEKDPPYGISVTGRVEESMLFYPRLELQTTITTWPDSNRFVIRDRVRNAGSRPSEMQLLYHCNFGSPLLQEGAQLHVPVLEIRPRDDHSARGSDGFRRYSGPGTSFQEEVFFLELKGSPEKTLAVLCDAGKRRAAALRFRLSQLPFFTLWKNTAAESDGYVTGLEPCNSLPNFRGVEREQGRLPVLQPGETCEFELEVEVQDEAAGVKMLLEEVRRCLA